MIFSGEEVKVTGTDADIPAIKIFVGSFASEEEDDSSKKITVNLVKRKENMFRRKIRKFLNHLV